MTLAIVSIATLAAAFIAPAALAMRYGVDSRVDDGPKLLGPRCRRRCAGASTRSASP